MECLCQSGYRVATDTTTCEQGMSLMWIEVTTDRRKSKSNKYAMTRKWGNQGPKPATKWEVTKITNSQNTKRTYGQPSEQLFPKRWPFSNPNRTTNIMNKHKVKCNRNSDREPQHSYCLGTVSNELLGT